MRRGLLALFLWLAFAGVTAAVQPGEILGDPALEARARGISHELRCMVCQNQSIDDSNADLARDLRLLVRERLTEGDTDAQVIDYVVARYGEFVLLKPRFNLRNALLWSTPVALLLIGGAVILLSVRRRRPDSVALSADERARLAELLQEPPRR